MCIEGGVVSYKIDQMAAGGLLAGLDCLAWNSLNRVVKASMEGGKKTCRLTIF